ncbi:MAG TPA: methyl-accepting chemotaxis protein [Acetivibrio sp.]|nr:methyl-accepting chemotaxis protein [Acetivibrio sp.]
MIKWFSNLGIGVRIIIGFFIIVAISCTIGVVGILNLKTVQDSYALDYKSSTDALECVEGISSHFQQIRLNTYGFAMSLGSEEKKEYYLERISEHKNGVDENISAYRSILDDYEASEVEMELKLLDNIQAALNEFGAMRRQIMDNLANGSIGTEEFSSLFSQGGEAYKLGSNVDSAIQELIDYNIDYAITQIAKNQKLADSSILVMIAVIIIGALFAIVLSLVISRGISGPINKVVAAADKLAEGDMDVSLDINSKDETGRLVDAFRNLVESTKEQAFIIGKIADGDLTVDVPIRSNKDLLGQKLSEMVHNINDLIMNIVSASRQVSAGAKQISDSSIALSQGASEQASSIEELSASIEEVSSKTRKNDDNAIQANDVAEKAKSYAVVGNAHMQEMLEAMNEINESSRNINKIIKVIDDIAFQTNILALNAAVEAARAGQHGKGFAVVAEEVRTLAGRSANAAKETTTLIEDSINKVETGAKIAKETAEALGKIVDGVQSVSNLVSEIKVASNEQATAIEQINQGIMQVSQVVQKNSATSQESASASEELSSQAEMLKQMVEKFKLKKTSAGSNSYDELSPEVIKMLDQIYKNKETEPGEIVLSDSKY